MREFNNSRIFKFLPVVNIANMLYNVTVIEKQADLKGANMNGGEFTIVGDTEKFENCLIYVCGDKDNATSVLNRMLNNPTPDDLYAMRGHKNLRINYTPNDKCWWNDPFLSN